MGINEIYLSVIIPAYNEEKRIHKILEAADSYFRKQDYDYEIIVVNDGSKDKTAEVVNQFKSKIKNLKLIDNKENHGKGYVVKQGMLAALGKYRLFADADNSTSIDQVEKVLPYFKEGFDVVIGSRAIKGAQILNPQPFYRVLLGKLGNIIIQIFAVWGISDTQCGFKCFTNKAAKDIFSRQTIYRWGFDVEILAIAKYLDYKIKEVPIVWINDPISHVKFSAYFQVLFETLKVRWNLITGKYK